MSQEQQQQNSMATSVSRAPSSSSSSRSSTTPTPYPPSIQANVAKGTKLLQSRLYSLEKDLVRHTTHLKHVQASIRSIEITLPILEEMERNQLMLNHTHNHHHHQTYKNTISQDASELQLRFNDFISIVPPPLPSSSSQQQQQLQVNSNQQEESNEQQQLQEQGQRVSSLDLNQVTDDNDTITATTTDDDDHYHTNGSHTALPSSSASSLLAKKSSSPLEEQLSLATTAAATDLDQQPTKSHLYNSFPSSEAPEQEHYQEAHEQHMDTIPITSLIDIDISHLADVDGADLEKYIESHHDPYALIKLSHHHHHHRSNSNQEEEQTPVEYEVEYEGASGDSYYDEAEDYDAEDYQFEEEDDSADDYKPFGGRSSTGGSGSSSSTRGKGKRKRGGGGSGSSGTAGRQKKQKTTDGADSADNGAVTVIPWNGEQYLTRKDLVIAAELKDPDHKNRTDRYKRQCGEDAFIELDESYFEELNQICSSINKHQFAYRKEKNGEESKRFIKLYTVKYLNYLKERPRIEFKHRKKRKARSNAKKATEYDDEEGDEMEDDAE